MHYMGFSKISRFFCLSILVFAPMSLFAQTQLACTIKQVYINKDGYFIPDPAAKNIINKNAMVEINADRTAMTFALGQVFQKDKIMQVIYPFSDSRHLLAGYSPNAQTPATIFFRLNGDTQEFSFSSLGYFPRIITGLCHKPGA